MPASGELNGSSRISPVYVNVYDLTTYNDYMYWFGLGIYHSGLEVHGVEYAFGAHDYASTGVFEVQPRNTPGFLYRTSILMGTTDMDPYQFREFLENAAEEYSGDSYHLIVKNCNHFTADVCKRLVGKDVPRWINRLARIGWCLNCILPEGLKVNDVKQTPEYHVFEGPDDGDSRHSIPILQTDYDSHEQRLLLSPNGISQSHLRDRTRDSAETHT